MGGIRQLLEQNRALDVAILHRQRLIGDSSRNALKRFPAGRRPTEAVADVNLLHGLLTEIERELKSRHA